MAGASCCCSRSRFLFIVANLAIGITFSTVATNQRQAMQMGMFYFLPNIILSGFMFPFRGMPRLGAGHRRDLSADAFSAHRARDFAERKSAGRFVAAALADRAVRVIAVIIGVKRYRQTLD